MNNAIDKEAQMHDNKFVTDERDYAAVAKTYDYDALMAEFQELVGRLMSKDSNYFAPRITQIVDKYLGKGKKIADATLEQAEFISLIITEIKDDLIPLLNK